MYGIMDVWMNRCMDVWMNGCMDEWMIEMVGYVIKGRMKGNSTIHEAVGGISLIFKSQGKGIILSCHKYTYLQGQKWFSNGQAKGSILYEFF